MPAHDTLPPGIIQGAVRATRPLPFVKREDDSASGATPLAQLHNYMQTAHIPSTATVSSTASPPKTVSASGSGCLTVATRGTIPSTADTYSTIPGTFGTRTASVAPTPSDSDMPFMTEIRSIPTAPATVEESCAAAANDAMFKHTSFANMGKRLKAYNDTLALLHELGVQHELQLPELVLVGDQSTGKSSLMSGLAGMNLPRSGGVCTRCVIHIHSSRSPQVSCRVSLRLKYRYEPRSVGANEAGPFPPWEPQHEVSQEFKTIDKIDEVEDVLRWAQIAVLNPDKNHEQYIPGSGHTAMNMSLATAAAQTTAKFSPNVVALELKGPEYANLSYYDLPGVFVTSTDENDMHLVKVVKNLTASYISHPGAIILWACPMNQDPVNSTTFNLIRRYGAQERTLGVITKADLVPEDPASHHQWLSMLNGARNNMRTGHGYFVTSRQTNKTLDEQNHWEDHFFQENSERWPSIFSQFIEQTGVERLRKRLSEMLYKAFTDSMPAIKNQVMSRYNFARNDLQSLPELPANVEMELNRSLTDFVARVKASIHHPEFSSSFQALCEQFRDCLAAMKPRIILHDESDFPEIIEVLSEGEEEQLQPTPRRKRTQDATYSTPSKRARNQHAAPGSSEPSRAATPGRQSDESRPGLARSMVGPTPQSLGPFSELCTPMKQTVGQVRETMRGFAQAGLPDVVSSEVYMHFCQEAVRAWNRPMETMLRLCINQVSEIVARAQQESLAKLRKRLVFDRVRSIMSDFVQACADQAEAQLYKTYKIHTYKLFTINKEDFARLQTDEAEVLEHYRHFQRWKAFRGGDSDLQYRPWAKMSAEERARDVAIRQAQRAKMGKDAFHKEVEVYSYVRGYYRLAAARFVDAVCLAINSDLYPTIVEELSTAHMEKSLGLVDDKGRRVRGPDVYERLMEEDEATAVKREKLKIEVAKFEKALQSINKLHGPEGEVDEGEKEAEADGETETDPESLTMDVDDDGEI
ncbi:hypothetical protein TD95_003217 [Thielaviopsis punctulata]|uniref:GED domain-containing protein n=1 Tax=Thielaviopsis punctulata TaxID=72032 RepID=A0A0F4ZE36_9PEZI|nr:hypothetical protein TD95_003217 [Thielaviopsis punctulata]